jgi:hypothetical protein
MGVAFSYTIAQRGVIVALISSSRRTLRDWRDRRRERRRAKHLRLAMSEAHRHTALRGRDEKTGGYGDPH